MGCVTKLLKLLVVVVAVFVGVLLGPNVLPENVKFTEFYVTPTKDLGKGAEFNQLLNNAEKLFEGELKGPEGFEIINGELYTTLHGGYVAKIFDDQIVPVVKFGQPCEGVWEESKCGRPLGIKANGKDSFVVADAYYGILQYNINTRKISTLVDKNTVIDGQKPQLFNGVDVAKDGSIYWTHSSSDFDVENILFTFLADGSGRLIKYDPVTKKNTVLMKGLFLANGLVLSPEEDYLLLAETGHSRILKFYLKGPKKFTHEVFIDGMPGSPDNLRQNGEGGYFVPLVVPRDDKNPAVFQVISSFPNLRKVLARLLSLLELSFEKLYKIYPHYFIKRALHFVGHYESIAPFLSHRASVLEIDSNGNVIRSYHCLDGSVTSISDVVIYNGYLYLGSPNNNYLARVEVSKLGDRRSSIHSVPYKQQPPTTTPPPRQTTTSRPTTTTSRPIATTQRPTTTTPKPTTTTPKPTTTTPKPTTTTPKPTTTTPKPTTTTPRPTTTTKPPPTTRPPPPPTTRPPPPPTTRPPPPPTTRPPPPPTTRPPPPPTTRPPPPPTTRPPPPPTTRPPPSPTTRSPPTQPPVTKPPPNSKNNLESDSQKKPEPRP